MKDVILSKSAWHVKFFTWATGKTDYAKWNNLCPYFWALLFMLLISPLTLIWKAVSSVVKLIIGGVQNINTKVKSKQVVNKTSKKKFSDVTIKRIETIFKWVGRIFVYCYFAFIGLAVLLGIYNLFVVNGAVLAFVYIFALIGFTAIILLIIWGLITYLTSDTHEMVKGMISAKKDKVCPHVTWVD